MDNLYRELAPISAAAWANLEEEARRTFRRHVAGRSIGDVAGVDGPELAAVGTGHLQTVEATAEGMSASIRRSPADRRTSGSVQFDRQQVDDVERGARDADRQPVPRLYQALRLGPLRLHISLGLQLCTAPATVHGPGDTDLP